MAEREGEEGAIERAAKNVIKASAYDEERRSDRIDWMKGIM